MKFLRNILISLALLVGTPMLGMSAANATQILLNNTYTKLTAAVGVSDTTITVTAGDGARFALATGGNTIRATLIKISGFREIAWEIVDITARSSDTLTITRARESTTALAFAVGDILDVRFTAGMSLGALGAATSAELAAIITNETGTGLLVFGTNPVLTTPNIGAATATSLAATGNISTSAGLINLGDTTAAAGLTQLGFMVSSVSTTAGPLFLLRRAGASAQGAQLGLAKSRGTEVAPTIVANADVIWAFNGYGYDGSTYFQSSAIVGSVDGTPGVSNMPGRITFYTAGATGAVQVRMAIDPAGHVKLNTTAPGLSACGTTPAIVGSDSAGTITMGTATPTGCVITFATPFTTTAPHCVVTWQTNLASMQYTVSTTAITLVQTATSSNKVNYVCFAST